MVKKSDSKTRKNQRTKKIQKAVTIINFKAYENATGDKALELAKICDFVAKDVTHDIIIAVQPTDIYRICQEVTIPVYSQHIDPVNFGSHTGHITPEAVRAAGATGTLLNHSEKRLRLDVLEESIKRAKDNGLKTVVCANDAVLGQAVCSMEPDFIAVEPPELIGGNISVSSAKPEIVKESVKRVGGYSERKNLLVGAGIKSNKDYKKSIQLGAVGVLVASGITKAKNPKLKLKQLIKDIR